LLRSSSLSQSLIVSPMEPLEAPKDKGICWECQGIDIAFALIYGRPGQQLWSVRWKDGPLSCTICTKIQVLLLPSSNSAGDAVPITSGRLLLKCYVDELYGWAKSRSRFLRLVLGDSTGQLCEVDLVPSHFARRVDPQISDLKIVRNWINICRSDHSHICGARLQKVPSSLRVIDCVGRSLCTLPLDAPYVCLSYVWGNIPAEQMPSADSLPILPKLIEDSIDVAVRIGIPFLWVDRYCIDQNNMAEKHDLIQNMDKVYRGAALTIVAVSGHSPHDGLPGINGTFRPQQQRFTIGPSGSSFTAVFVPNVEVKRSRYQTRGW
jgi:hypothetical protein